MSRSADLLGSCHAPGHGENCAPHDAGFTLVEVIVALGITMVVMVALLPQLIVGLRSTDSANSITESKGLAQSELERMRNLPYHVAPAAGNYVDVLDRYYPNLGTPSREAACADPTSITAASWTGYVAPSSTARCSFEPATGAFYRTVRSLPGDGNSNSPVVVVVTSQFLSSATPPLPLTPRLGYDTSTNGKHFPASSQFAASVTVMHTERGKTKPVTTTTQVVEQPSAPTRILADARVTALYVGSVTPDARALSLSAGLVNLVSGVSTVSTVTENATAVTATLATGEQASGATSTHQAPPSQTVPASSAPAAGLPVFGCDYACWGPSQISGADLRADEGLPRAGTSDAPLQASISNTSTNSGIRFGTDPVDTTDPATASSYRSGLQLSGPLVSLDPTVAASPAQMTGCAMTAPGSVSASGFLHATDGATGKVTSCAAAASTPVSVLPTTFAPRGIIRILLERAWVQCTASSTAGTAALDYRAVVQVWNGSAYTTVATVLPGASADPLASVDMTMPVGGDHTLGDYLASWSSPTTSTVGIRQGPGAAEVAVPGVVTLTTQPLRSDSLSVDGLDATSAVAATLGAVNCSTEDRR